MTNSEVATIKRDWQKVQDQTFANFCINLERFNLINTPLCAMPVNFAEKMIKLGLFGEISLTEKCYWKDTEAIQRWKDLCNNIKKNHFQKFTEKNKEGKERIVYSNWFRVRPNDIIATLIAGKETFYTYHQSTWADIFAIEITPELRKKIEEQKKYERIINSFYKVNKIKVDFKQSLF